MRSTSAGVSRSGLQPDPWRGSAAREGAVRCGTVDVMRHLAAVGTVVTPRWHSSTSGIGCGRMEIIPDKRKVVGLVEQAHEGKICLPNFQRDFVWTREEVADLVRSIVRGYFIGSLLLLRCDASNPPFAPIFLRGAKPPIQEPRPELLILDGQQRLSSLLYALTAPDLSLKDSSQRHWFFLNLQVLLSEPDSDDIVFDRARRELRGLDA